MATKHGPAFGACAAVLLFLSVLAAELPGWSKPILIANDPRYTYDKPQLKYDASGVAYITYAAATVGSNTSNIFLSRFDGSKVQFLRNVSETSLHAYEADLGVSKTGQIHVAWVESRSGSGTQQIRYRSFNGGSWSAIQTLATVTSVDLVEDLRLAVDGSNNVFVVFMIWPLARCKFISKYGSTVRFEDFPVSGRSKHPDVQADGRYVYIAWQHMLDGRYTILSQRKSNSPSGGWLSTQDLRHYDTQRPRIDADSSYNQHVVYWHDLGATRKMFYKYWTGSAFSSARVVSDADDYLSYHFADFALKGSRMIATMQVGGYYGGRAVCANWGKDRAWGTVADIPSSIGLQPAMASVDLTSAGNAAVALASSNKAVYVILSDGDAPIPPPPPPDPVPNVPPTANFTFSPLSGLFPLPVSFNAGSSRDSDGQIVSYAWDFGDGASGSGVQANHVYQRRNRFIITLTVTDDDGATATATGEVEVFGLYPPLDVNYTRHENRNLFSIEYLYRITWKHNPENDAVGAKIVSYKIYRREKGATYPPGVFHVYPAGNQTEFEFLDRTLGSSAREYEYRISSVDSQGRESDLN